ncbi:hypothetical protein CSW25_13750 [Thermus scotoductus]|uniref:Uncharacterized protein n=1 Tax=Thermus scotoductus TaxID=37636 RepID=A0A430SBL6_THESC|nr:hypothetical protein CSW48_11950 [Thermus scotoductus]RTH12406.1 hypothetical protein CSW46_02215 [Thermus scotoductus]RTH12694.1 hypothetical protein CSW44_03415 [Thermus scotoductus]RTH13496.1 hypothetical protein CSW43_03580 [Thermus scotoductus]RTH18921.1 hypothetical protein CSW39_03865 [Thermus scotoductus]
MTAKAWAPILVPSGLSLGLEAKQPWTQRPTLGTGHTPSLPWNLLGPLERLGGLGVKGAKGGKGK